MRGIGINQLLKKEWKRIGHPSRNYNVPAFTSGKIPFVKRGTRITIIGRCLGGEGSLLFYLPTRGYIKVHYSNIDLEELDEATEDNQLEFQF